MLAVAPAATLTTFMDILDVASWSYENVLRLLNTNVEMDSGIMLSQLENMAAENLPSNIR